MCGLRVSRLPITTAAVTTDGMPSKRFNFHQSWPLHTYTYTHTRKRNWKFCTNSETALRCRIFCKPTQASVERICISTANENFNFGSFYGHFWWHQFYDNSTKNIIAHQWAESFSHFELSDPVLHVPKRILTGSHTISVAICCFFFFYFNSQINLQ